MKNTLDRINSRLDVAERFCELEDTAIEITQNKTHIQKVKKQNSPLVNHGTTINS